METGMNTQIDVEIAMDMERIKTFCKGCNPKSIRLFQLAYILIDDLKKASGVSSDEMIFRNLHTILEEPNFGILTPNMISLNISYTQSLFEKCMGNEGLIILRKVLEELANFTRGNKYLNDEIMNQKLEHIFATVNQGIWTETMIAFMKLLICNLTIMAECKLISSSVTECKAVASYIKKLKPNTN